MDVPKRKTISMIFLHPKFQRNSSKKSRQTSDNLVKGHLKSTSAYHAFEQHQTGSNSILNWLTRSPDEPSVQIRIWLFLSSSSNSANEPCILLRQGVDHTAHHFRFRISRLRMATTTPGLRRNTKSVISRSTHGCRSTRRMEKRG